MKKYLNMLTRCKMKTAEDMMNGDSSTYQHHKNKKLISKF